MFIIDLFAKTGLETLYFTGVIILAGLLLGILETQSNRICSDVFAERTDLFEIKADIEGEKYEQTETGYDLRLFLPNITKDEVAVNLSGSDVIVKIGNYKRNIPMPNTLRGMTVTSAKFDQNTLVIAFK